MKKTDAKHPLSLDKYPLLVPKDKQLYCNHICVKIRNCVKPGYVQCIWPAKVSFDFLKRKHQTFIGSMLYSMVVDTGQFQ